MKLNYFLLLQIKQVPGLEQEQLLYVLNEKYSNINSARAALSRALRMMLALGLITKKNKAYNITKKGLIELKKQLKITLLINLNELINQPRAFKSIDKIVSLLSILIERSKTDTELLNAAISQSKFFISDLTRINKSFEKHLKNQEYLKNIMIKQVKELKKLNFNEIIELKASKRILKKILSSTKTKKIFLMTSNSLLSKKISLELKIKPKRGNLIIDKKDSGKLFQILLERKNAKFELVISKIKVKHRFGVLLIQGPFKILQGLKKQKAVVV